MQLDPGKQSTLTLGQNGTLNAKTYLVLDLPLELRNGDDGCAKPYITTGYSSASETVNLSGKIGAAGPRAGARVDAGHGPRPASGA